MPNFISMGFNRLYQGLIQGEYSANTFQELKDQLSGGWSARFNESNKYIIEYELSQNQSEVWIYKTRGAKNKTLVLREDELGGLKIIEFM